MRQPANHRERMVDREIRKLELRQLRQRIIALRPRSEESRERPTRPMR